MGERRPLTPSQLRATLRSHWPGLCLLGLHFSLVSALKDVRDVFQPELWTQLHHTPPSSFSFVLTELPATLTLFLFLSSLARVRSNRLALLLVMSALILSSASLPLLSSLRARGAISGSAWFSALGVSTYLAYVPVSTVLFDRMAGALHFGGTAAIFIQVN